MTRPLAVLLLSAACGASDAAPTRPLSAVEHEQAAREHERAARAHAAASSTGLRGDEAGDHYRCIDNPLVGVTYAGTEPIRVMRPCWTVESNPTDAAMRDVELHRREAARHREVAATLLKVEREACVGLGEDEISHSPFHHADDILLVEPVRRGGEVVGARAVFRRVEGLDADWMRRATACHHARAGVMGYSPTFQSYDPLSVPDISIAIDEVMTGVAVTITARTAASAATVWGRMQALASGEVPPLPH
jgi:hypothetical protein